jgi:hypothetical protein
MAHFYGTLQGSRGQATRCGTKASGMRAIAASWNGSIVTGLSYNPDAPNSDRLDVADVGVQPWHGKGQSIALYRGPAGGAFNVYIKTVVDGWLEPCEAATQNEADALVDRLKKEHGPTLSAVCIVPMGSYFRGF